MEHTACLRIAILALLGTALLADSDGITHTTYFTNGSNCEVPTDLSFCDRCIMTDACCLYLPVSQDNSKCSAYW